MKKITIFFMSVFQFVLLSGQNENKAVPNTCDASGISGSTTIQVGQTLTYSSVYAAQCTSCYDWDINSDPNSSDNSTVANLKIVGTDVGNTVSIQALAVGTAKISLTYFDETGCHSYCKVINVIEGGNCCAPILFGWFECHNGSKTGGGLRFDDNLDCPVDWTKISSINVSINGATFNTPYSGNTITLTGPFTGSPASSNDYLSVSDTVLECYYGNSFGAIVTFNYNNGCPSVQKGGNWYDYNTPPSFNKTSAQEIKLYPNPTNSIIEFQGENIKNYQISIFNINGKNIINKTKLDKKIDLSKYPSGTYLYKIEDQNKTIQEGKITKQ